MQVGELTARLSLDLKDFQSRLKQAQSDFKGVGEKLQSTAQNLKGVGTTMAAGLTAPMAAIGAISMKTAVDFDDSMRKVQAVSGATGKELEALHATARELGRTTQFSASQAAEGMQYLAMAGFDTQEVLSAMPGMLDLAAAGALDLGSAADIASNILSGFGLQAAEIGSVGDVMAKASSSANTNIEELGYAMKYVGPVAASAGLSLEEVTAAVGKLSDAGIKGEQAGTVLRSAISNLLSPSKATAEAIMALGLNIEDLNPATNSLADILGTLSEAGIDTASAIDIFGQEAGPGMLALLSVGEEGLRGFTRDLENAGGTAEKMAKTMNDGPGGALREMKSALEDVSITIGDSISTAFLPFIKKIQELANWFSNLSPTAQQVILVLGGIAAAIGPLLIVAGSLISAFTTLAPVFTAAAGAIGAISAPVAIAVGAIVGLIAIGVALYKNWDEIKAKATEIWNAISEFFTETWENIKSTAAESWDNIKSGLSQAWNEIKTKTKNIFSEVKNFLANTWDNITNNFSNAFGNMVDKAFQFGKDIMNSLKEGLASIEIPIPDIDIEWKRGFMGVRYPVFNLGVNWKSLGDIIPGLAEGGTILSPGAVMVGEEGPEILNLPRAASVTPLDRAPAVQATGGIRDINVYVYGSVGVKDIAQQLVDEFRLKTGLKI